MSSLTELQDLIKEKYDIDPSSLDPNASMREHGIETGNLPVNVGAAIAQAIGTLLAKVQRLTGVLGLVLTETGLQAHKHGCPERLRRPAQWDQTLPCAGCAAEAALSTEIDR